MWANVDPDLCHHMVSLGHNELNPMMIHRKTYISPFIIKFCVFIQMEHVDRFVHQLNTAMHQKHEQERLSAIINRIESYEAIDFINDECQRVNSGKMSIFSGSIQYWPHVCLPNSDSIYYFILMMFYIGWNFNLPHSHILLSLWNLFCVFCCDMLNFDPFHNAPYKPGQKQAYWRTGH